MPFILGVVFVKNYRFFYELCFSSSITLQLPHLVVPIRERYRLQKGVVTHYNQHFCYSEYFEYLTRTQYFEVYWTLLKQGRVQGVVWHLVVRLSITGSVFFWQRVQFFMWRPIFTSSVFWRAGHILACLLTGCHLACDGCKKKTLITGYHTSSLKCAHESQCVGLQMIKLHFQLSNYFATLHEKTWYWPFCIEYENNMISHTFREEPAVSYRWTGWVWIITCWSLTLQENYQPV